MGNYNNIYRMDTQAKVSASVHIQRNDDIDVDRLVWDVEYREVVKRFLQPRDDVRISLGA